MPGGVLVTGGAGFVGSHLVERLVTAGATTSVVDDLSRGRRSWVHPGAEFHQLDLRDPDAVRRTVAVVAPDVVVHLAAMHFIPAVEGAPDVAREINVEGTRTLLAALVPAPPELLVFASSAAVYPDRRGPIDESCPPRPIDVYGETKIAGERLVARFGSKTHSRCIVARIFNVVGRRETNLHVVPDLVGQLARGRTVVRLGNLEPRRDYTAVTDVAAALHALLGSPEGGRDVFNVGSGRAVSVAELVEVCARILGRAITVEVDRGRRRARDRAELVADSTLLRETTGWRPTRSLEETLAELLADAEGSRPLAFGRAR